MRLPVLLLPMTFSAACAAVPPRATDPGSARVSESRNAGDDEVAEERAIVQDPRVIAAAEHVRVIQNDTLGCPAEIMGLVDIHEPVKSEEQALDVLRRKAAKMGAEAVIGVEFHHGEPDDEPTHLSGLAVRCNDLVKGRSYDVLGKIEIKGQMGKEDEAEGQLLSRAREMRADLVIDIGFEHGEGGSVPTRVWGTAIRFR